MLSKIKLHAQQILENACLFNGGTGRLAAALRPAATTPIFLSPFRRWQWIRINFTWNGFGGSGGRARDLHLSSRVGINLMLAAERAVKTSTIWRKHQIALSTSRRMEWHTFGYFSVLCSRLASQSASQSSSSSYTWILAYLILILSCSFFPLSNAATRASEEPHSLLPSKLAKSRFCVASYCNERQNGKRAKSIFSLSCSLFIHFSFPPTASVRFLHLLWISGCLRRGAQHTRSQPKYSFFASRHREKGKKRRREKYQNNNERKNRLPTYMVHGSIRSTRMAAVNAWRWH